MRSDNLHIQSCMGKPTSKNLVEGRRQTSMNVPNGIAEKPPMNSKIQALLKEILNDSSAEEIGKEKVQSIPPQVTFPPSDVVFWKEPLRALDLNLQAENLIKKSQPRTKHIIIGSSNDKDGFDEQSSSLLNLQEIKKHGMVMN